MFDFLDSLTSYSNILLKTLLLQWSHQTCLLVAMYLRRKRVLQPQFICGERCTTDEKEASQNDFDMPPFYFNYLLCLLRFFPFTEN